jgi:hypothetical protein
MERRNGKELNLDRNKIVNLKDPQDPQDAATKRYTDSLVREVHMLSPLNNRAEYIRVINTKQTTMVNLAPIMTISTDLNFAHSYSSSSSHEAHYLLEGLCASNRIYLNQKDLTNKHITLSYRFPVNVDAWKLRIRSTAYSKHIIKFHWETSMDGKNWERSKTIEAETEENYWNGNTHELTFVNNIHGLNWYFWRIVFEHGTLADPWINLLLMQIQENEP